MSIDISDLRLFIKIVQVGSLAEAARATNVSPPSVTRRLATMERRLGCRLIERTTRHLSLTEQGNFLNERAIELLHSFDRLEADTLAQSTMMAGPLRVSAPNELGRKIIAPLLADFCDSHTDINGALVLSGSRHEGDDTGVNTAGLDLAIRMGAPDDPNVVVRKMTSTRRILCASPSYLARNPAPLRPSDLWHHDCIRLIRGRHLYDEWSFRNDTVGDKVQQIKVTGKLTTDSGEVLHDWLVAGRGIGLKAGWDVAVDIAEGRLVECLGDYWCNEAELYACFYGGTQIPLRVRRFVDYVVRSLLALPFA